MIGAKNVFQMSCDAASTTFTLGPTTTPNDINLSCSATTTSAQIVTALANFTTWLNRVGDSNAAMGDGQSGTFTP